MQTQSILPQHQLQMHALPQYQEVVSSPFHYNITHRYPIIPAMYPMMKQKMITKSFEE